MKILNNCKNWIMKRTIGNENGCLAGKTGEEINKQLAFLLIIVLIPCQCVYVVM